MRERWQSGRNKTRQRHALDRGDGNFANEEEQEEQNSSERPKKTAEVDKSKIKTQQPVKLTNKFGLLQRNEDQAGPSNLEEINGEQPPTKRKTSWIPLIVKRQQVADYLKFTTDIQEDSNWNSWDRVKIFADTYEEQENLIQELKDTKVDFSDPRREEKLKKFVLKATPTWKEKIY